MKSEKRTALQTYSAIGMLAVGVGLCIAGFIVPPLGVISDSVLWFFGQCLIYSGSIFGVGLYVNSKFYDFRQRLGLGTETSEENQRKNDEK